LKVICWKITFKALQENNFLKLICWRLPLGWNGAGALSLKKKNWIFVMFG
jgi:hypothetical protein